jgi:hypothetical protein
MTKMGEGTDFEMFLRGEIDPRGFSHVEHVRMAFQVLGRYDFAEAAFRFSRALRIITRSAGKPEIFHQTLTIAFLALIAERMHARAYSDFDAFAAANQDLMSRSALARWYSPQRLASDAARATFVLPDL